MAKCKYECLWYEGATEKEAMNGDPETKEFDKRSEALGYYNKHKNDPNKFGWWVTKRDEDWNVIEDIIY